MTDFKGKEMKMKKQNNLLVYLVNGVVITCHMLTISPTGENLVIDEDDVEKTTGIPVCCIQKIVSSP